ncbi:HEAT repeat domain-containing protein [Streptomyces sp. NBC_01259]|uniref:HEAT repeat domain-containing protein n=1 Tax=unclassified Streptomyces TaxID=2593676 RepID=UPI002E14D28D|nr:HEAT repeat domain-containing protein [Streptomyces sp. NBC_01324]
MDGYQGLTAMIESAWEELNGSDAGRRDLCLDVISDVLETARLTPGDAERAVEHLVAVALSDEGHPVRESALHAVLTASTHYELPYRVVEPLAVGADAFESVLLDYVLGVLGSTHDQAVLPVVERFLQHPHPEVRREAAEAVNEVRRSRRETAEGGTAQ